MDLETENRLAALLMEEARRLRAEADKEGVHAYLRQPNVRGRLNSRFLTATVLGVEQANRAVQVNEMWRAREKEMELDVKLKSRAKFMDGRYCDKNLGDSRKKVSSSRHEEEACRSSASSSKRRHEDHPCYSSEEAGLRDDEVEEFLRSRAKRGRGDIGSRMDEPGPYPSAMSSAHDAGKLLVDPDTREKEEWERRILGPQKPSFIKSHELPPEEVRDADSSKKKQKHHSKEKKKKKRLEEERAERKNTEKKCKHRRHKSRSDSE